LLVLAREHSVTSRGERVEESGRCVGTYGRHADLLSDTSH